MILKGFLKKEITQLLRNRVLIFALLVMPVVQVLILSSAITNEPKNLKIALDIQPNDYLMSRVYDRAISSGWFLKVDNQTSDALKTVQSAKADAAIIAPQGGFTRALLRGEGQMQILIDATNIIRAQALDGYIRAITWEVLADEMKRLQFPAGSTITFSQRVLFNPQLDTKLFMVPFIMSIVVFTSIMSMVCVSVAKEVENGTIETLISAPINKFHIIIGKVIPAVLISFLNFITILSIGIIMFDLPFRAGIIEFVLTFMSFAFASSTLALFMSTYCKTQQQAMLCMMMMSFLMIMLSGGMFPIENMPDVLQYCCYINPLSHFTYLVRNLVLKGGDLKYFIEHTSAMIIFGGVATVFAFRRFKVTL